MWHSVPQHESSFHIAVTMAALSLLLASPLSGSDILSEERKSTGQSEESGIGSWCKTQLPLAAQDLLLLLPYFLQCGLGGSLAYVENCWLFSRALHHLQSCCTTAVFLKQWVARPLVGHVLMSNRLWKAESTQLESCRLYSCY